MSYTPPATPFVDNPSPVGGGLGQSLNASFFSALVAGVDDADTRLTALEPSTVRNPLTGWYHVDGYGANMAAGTGGRAAVQAAVDAAAAAIIATNTGRTVYIPEGVVLFDVRHPAPPDAYSGGALGVALPVNLPATLRIKGAGRGLTTIRLTTNSRNVFWIKKVADYDVFQNYVFEDFDVDNNNAPGRCHILVGSTPEYETGQTRLSYRNITVKRISCYNVPFDVAATTTVKPFITFEGKHLAANEATQTFTRDIFCEDLEMVDCQYGLAINSPVVTGATNHFYDNIHFRRCNHTINTIPNTNLAQTSYYVGGSGFGGDFSIVDCTSTNIGDDAIEVGSMQTGLIERFRSTNPYLEHILFRLTHPLTNAAMQRIVIRDSTLTVTGALMTASGASGALSAPIKWINDLSTTENFGTFVLDNVTHKVDGARILKLGRGEGLAFNSLGFRFRGAILRLIATNCSVHYRNFLYDASGIQDCDFFYVSLSPNGVGDSNRGAGVAELRDCSVYMEGTTGTSPDAGGMNLFGINSGGGKGRVIVDNFTFETVGHSPVNAIATASMALAGGHGTPQLVHLKGLSGHSYSTAAGGFTRRGVVARATTLFDKLIVQDSDFRQWSTGSTSNDVDTSAAGANAAKVVTINNLASP